MSLVLRSCTGSASKSFFKIKLFGDFDNAWMETNNNENTVDSSYFSFFIHFTVTFV